MTTTAAAPTTTTKYDSFGSMIAAEQAESIRRMNATHPLVQKVVRETEAIRIAAAEGFAIADHDDDWEFFELADDLLIESGPARGKWCHTFFSWVEGRWEGAVSLSKSTAA